MRRLQLLGATIAMTLLGSTASAETIKLPTPNKTSGKPLMETMNKRQSDREFSEKSIDNQTLSEILWSAFGKNAKGTRTIPTANNKRNLKVYAVMANGAWFYDGEKHVLTQVTKKDLKKLLGQQQEFVLNAPLSLVFVGSDKDYSPMHAGSSYQNVGLYAASKGIRNVVRAWVDKNELKKELKLNKEDYVIVSQTLGYAK